MLQLRFSETMEALEILLQQGKIRAAGVSNYSVEQVAEARQSLNIASNQIGYSMLNRGVENDLVPYALENDLGNYCLQSNGKRIIDWEVF